MFKDPMIQRYLDTKNSRRERLLALVRSNGVQLNTVAELMDCSASKIVDLAQNNRHFTDDWLDTASRKVNEHINATA